MEQVHASQVPIIPRLEKMEISLVVCVCKLFVAAFVRVKLY